MRVAVLGGGVTGLTAALALLRGGAAVALFEARAEPGGLAGSFQRDGYTFDYGPHELCTDDPLLLGFLREVCGEDLVEVRKSTAQYFRGRTMRFPFEVSEVLASVGPLLCLRAGAEVAWSRLRNRIRRPRDESFEEWTRSRFGRTLYELYFGPYTEKVWGVDPGLLDTSTASDRISSVSLWQFLRKSLAFQFLGREDRAPRHSELRRSFLYTRGGIRGLSRHLAAGIEAGGGELSCGKRLVRLDAADGRVEALRFADGTSIGGFDAVLSTVPLPHLVEAALGEAASELLAANELPFRGMVFAFLRIDKPRVTDFDWTYFSDGDVPFQRFTEFARFEPGMAPPGRTGLAVEISCDPGDDTWSLEDAAIERLVTEALVGLDLLRPEEILGCDVARLTCAYPIQVRGFQERTDRLLDALSPLANLITLGRQGLFRYCNMDECMQMALEVAPRILAGESSVRYRGEGSWKGVWVEGS